MATKQFRASITVEFPYDKMPAPLAVAAKIEEAMTLGVTALREINDTLVITTESGIVNVRDKKPATPAAPAAAATPTADPALTELADAVAQAGGHPGGPGNGSPAVFAGGAAPALGGAS